MEKLQSVHSWYPPFNGMKSSFKSILVWYFGLSSNFNNMLFLLISTTAFKGALFCNRYWIVKKKNTHPDGWSNRYQLDLVLLYWILTTSENHQYQLWDWTHTVPQNVWSLVLASTINITLFIYRCVPCTFRLMSIQLLIHIYFSSHFLLAPELWISLIYILCVVLIL